MQIAAGPPDNLPHCTEESTDIEPPIPWSCRLSANRIKSVHDEHQGWGRAEAMATEDCRHAGGRVFSCLLDCACPTPRSPPFRRRPRSPVVSFPRAEPAHPRASARPADSCSSDPGGTPSRSDHDALSVFFGNTCSPSPCSTPPRILRLSQQSQRCTEPDGIFPSSGKVSCLGRGGA